MPTLGFATLSPTFRRVHIDMIFIPRDASDDQVLEIIRKCIDVLATEDYEQVFKELGYSMAYGEPGAECIRKEIKRYRSPDHYPGIEDFTVTNWRTAKGGNPAPRQKVIWYKSNSIKLAGAVDFDLPLNGKWSDLRADFVFFDNSNYREGYVLALEEILCDAQREREMEQQDS